MKEYTQQELRTQEAFSKQSLVFDEEDSANPILQWMRSVVRKSSVSVLKKGDRILELNCGTGIDSVFFAQRGFHVTATDIAPGMLEQLEKKRIALHLEDKIDTQLLSFNKLELLQGKKFDHVFSNFGGLNCTDDLDAVIQNIKHLLNPGGSATLVIMPPVCLWELALALKGNFKIAFRRLKKNGAVSNLEGVTFTTWYYTAAYVAKSFGKDFTVKEIKALGLFVPPPYLFNTAIKHPRFFSFVKKIEQKTADWLCFRSTGDHFVITLQKDQSLAMA